MDYINLALTFARETIKFSVTSFLYPFLGIIEVRNLNNNNFLRNKLTLLNLWLVKFLSWTYGKVYGFPLIGNLNRYLINAFNFNYNKLFVTTYYGRERKFVIENEPVINILEVEYYNEHELLFDGKIEDKFFEKINVINDGKENELLNDMIGFDSLTTTIGDVDSLSNNNQPNELIINMQYTDLENGDDVIVSKTLDINTLLKDI